MDFLANYWGWLLVGGVVLWFVLRGRGMVCGMGHSHGETHSHVEHTEAPGPQGGANQQPAPQSSGHRGHGCC